MSPVEPPEMNAWELPPQPESGKISLWERAGRLGRLTLKELREILRDRRTIATLVLMPLLLYPLLSVVFQRFLLAGFDAARMTVFHIGIENDRDALLLDRCLKYAEWDPARMAKGESPPPTRSGPVLELYQLPDLEAGVRQQTVDLAVKFGGSGPVEFDPAKNLQLDCELIFVEGSPLGDQAREYIEDQLQRAGARFLTARLRQLNVSQSPTPLAIRTVSVEAPQQRGAVSLASLVPLILILMTITGAVYPAIDLTAGERERGTLEMLIAAPVPRLGLLFAKYVAVFTIAFLTATVNLVAMTITLLSSGFGSWLFGSEGLPLATVLQVFGLLLVFAAFFSAVLLTLTSFARSFKEAQAYLIPLMLFSLAPGLASLIPGIELSGWLLVTPLLNIALLARNLLEGHADPASAAIVVLSTLLFALAAISLAARIFGTDVVLYSRETGWSDLFRRPPEAQPAATVSSTLLCLALMFPTQFVLVNWIARLPELSIAARFSLMTAATGVIFGIFPGVFAWLGHVRWSTGFRFRPAPLLAFVAAVLLGVSLWPFATQLTLLARQAGLGTLREEHFTAVRSMLLEARELSPFALLVSFAVVPAVFEELFFRGFLFSALLRRTTPAMTILTSAGLFALFHLITTDGFALERLIPSLLLGLVLSWVCWRSGSMLPGIALHFANNAVLAMLAYYAPAAAREGDSAAVKVPLLWLMIAAAGAAAGWFLFSRVLAGEKDGERDDAAGNEISRDP